MQQAEKSVEHGMHWLVHAGIGLVCGLFAIVTREVGPQSVAGISFHAAMLGFLITGGFVAQMSLSQATVRRSVLASVVLGLVFALPVAWIFSEIGRTDWYSSGNEDRAFTGILTLFGSVCIMLAFVRTWLEQGRFSFPYKKLFDHSLDALNIVVVAGIFTGAFWLLIVLWAELFDLLDISFFSDLFGDEYFIFLALPISASIGIAIGRASENVVQALKRFLLVICRVLLPMVALIVALFLLALLIQGLEALWNTNMAASLLLTLQVLVIFLYNGVVQQGETPPESRIMRYVVEGVALTLPVFSILTWYAIILRLDQYGLTPSRSWALATCLVSGLYGLGYAASAIATHFREDGWMGLMRPVNVAMAFVIPLLMILMHTPLLDPLNRSADSQYAKLLDPATDPETFSLLGMRYDYGRAGVEYLEYLEENMDALVEQGVLTRDKADIIAYRLDNEEYYATEPQVELQPGQIEMSGGMELSDPLFEAIEWVFENQGWYYTGEMGRIMARPVQADDDEAMECLVFIQNSYDKLYLLDESDASWVWVGTYQQNIDEEALMNLFPAASLEPRPRQFMDMEMGGNEFRFQHKPVY